MVLEPQANKFCALNQTSSAIWARLKEPASAEELAQHLTEEFQGVTSNDALQDVNLIIAEMASLGILVSVE